MEVNLPFAWTRIILAPLQYIGWAAIIFLLFGLASNRCAAAWGILVPVGLMNLVIWGGSALLFPNATALEIIPPVLMSVPFALAAAFLAGDYLTRLSFATRVFLGMALGGIVGGGSFLGHYSEGQSQEFLIFTLILIILSALSVLSFFLFSRFRGQRLAWLRFLGIGAGQSLLLALVATVIVTVQFLIPDIPRTNSLLLHRLYQVPFIFLGSMLYGALIFLELIPFLLLCHLSPFYRSRWDALSGRETPQDPSQKV